MFKTSVIFYYLMINKILCHPLLTHLYAATLDPQSIAPIVTAYYALVLNDFL
jgi:hypothetical protein